MLDLGESLATGYRGGNVDQKDRLAGILVENWGGAAGRHFNAVDTSCGRVWQSFAKILSFGRFSLHMNKLSQKVIFGHNNLYYYSVYQVPGQLQTYSQVSS